MLLAECARLNRAGLTTCSEMAFDPMFRPVSRACAANSPSGCVPTRSPTPQMATDVTPDNGDDMVRQVGIKIWVDGSPWIGNIDLSFPYLDTEATRTIGVHARLVRVRQLHQRAAHRDRRRLLPAGLADGLPRAGRRRRRHDPRRLRRSTAQAPAGRSPAAARTRRRDHGTSNCSAPTTSGSRAASSSTRSTTGATSSSTGCSGPSTAIGGCRAGRRSRPGCASRCTTTRR